MYHRYLWCWSEWYLQQTLANAKYFSTSYVETSPVSHNGIAILCRGLIAWICRCHDDVIKWKHFPRYWPFVRGIHRWPVNSPHKGQWRGAFMFSLICVWINNWINNIEAGDLRRHHAHYDVIVMPTRRKSKFITFGLCVQNFGVWFNVKHLNVRCFATNLSTGIQRRSVTPIRINCNISQLSLSD